MAGFLFVIAAPSGTGKTTLGRMLVESDSALEFSISYTTRAPRGSERDGEAYRFISKEDFDRRIASGDFLEWAEVHRNYYGSGLARTRAVLDRGQSLLMDIDVQGAAQLRARSDVDVVTVLLLPPDGASLVARLRGRGTDDPQEIQRRLEVAAGEAAEFSQFDYLVVNEQKEAALAHLQAILAAERQRAPRQAPLAEHILQSLRGFR